MTGKVRRLTSYLSNNQRAVYTEFEVQVDEVLRNHTPHALRAGATIIVSRLGGVLRMPTGAVVTRHSPSESMPLPDVETLFFLQYNGTAADSFMLMDGFELAGDAVLRLNAVSRPRTGQSVTLSPYDKPATELLRLVRQAVLQPPMH